MIFYDLSFAPDGIEVRVIIDHKVSHAFPSRKQALQFIWRHARSQRKNARTVTLSIEGADGRWRAFDPMLMPLAQA